MLEHVKQDIKFTPVKVRTHQNLLRIKIYKKFKSANQTIEFLIGLLVEKDPVVKPYLDIEKPTVNTLLEIPNMPDMSKLSKVEYQAFIDKMVDREEEEKRKLDKTN